MIKFSLICDCDHRFEGWFSSSSDFDDQKKRGLVSCPVCDSASVEKSLMTPSVTTSKKNSNDNAMVAKNPPPKEYQEMMSQLRKMRDHVTANAENVGDNFSEEARKIHYGEAETRGIYGKASPEDVRGLVEEGVEVLPLPDLPEDKN